MEEDPDDNGGNNDITFENMDQLLAVEIDLLRFSMT